MIIRRRHGYRDGTVVYSAHDAVTHVLLAWVDLDPAANALCHLDNSLVCVHAVAVQSATRIGSYSTPCRPAPTGTTTVSVNTSGNLLCAWCQSSTCVHCATILATIGPILYEDSPALF